MMEEQGMVYSFKQGHRNPAVFLGSSDMQPCCSTIQQGCTLLRPRHIAGFLWPCVQVLHLLTPPPPSGTHHFLEFLYFFRFPFPYNKMQSIYQAWTGDDHIAQASTMSAFGQYKYVLASLMSTANV